MLILPLKRRAIWLHIKVKYELSEWVLRHAGKLVEGS